MDRGCDPARPAPGGDTGRDQGGRAAAAGQRRRGRGRAACGPSRARPDAAGPVPRLPEPRGAAATALIEDRYDELTGCADGVAGPPSPRPGISVRGCLLLANGLRDSAPAHPAEFCVMFGTAIPDPGCCGARRTRPAIRPRCGSRQSSKHSSPRSGTRSRSPPRIRGGARSGARRRGQTGVGAVRRDALPGAIPPVARRSPDRAERSDLHGGVRSPALGAGRCRR